MSGSSSQYRIEGNAPVHASNINTENLLMTKSGSQTQESAAAQTTTVCQPGQPECKSMCRWLKMVDQDNVPNDKCPLFDWQLKSCNQTYLPPEDRPFGAEEMPIDCAVKLLRINALPADIAMYVNQLDDCVKGLPSELNKTCSVAIGLLNDEISDWKKEDKLKKQADTVRVLLDEAVKEGNQALHTQKLEQEAIDKLSSNLAKAETLPGHYLVDSVHAARKCLDKLGPIPAVRDQLHAALEDGHHAFETTDLFRVKESMVWLDVAIQKAKRYRLHSDIQEPKQILKKLDALKASLVELKTAIFQGNMSVTTQSDVPLAVAALKHAIGRAKDAGLTNSMPIANDLLRQLERLEKAVRDEALAKELGEKSLMNGGNKGREALRVAIGGLNQSIGKAIELGLDDNETTTASVAVLDKLLYLSHARAALHHAVVNGWMVVNYRGALLSDDGEEASEDVLAPAITWAEEAGLVRGLATARKLANQLRSIEQAKEGMLDALAVGNASLRAKTFTKRAIRTLKDAISGCTAVNITAGISTAEHQIELLRAIYAARSALRAAQSDANKSLHMRANYGPAVQALNSSIRGAVAVGLREEAAIAKDQMLKLEQFAEADEAIRRAMAKRVPAREPPVPHRVVDTKPLTVFNRTGYRVDSLPEVPNSEDDGDADFQEHIRALVAAIARGKHHGVIDPTMEADLALMRAKQEAYTALRKAIHVGEGALQTKTNLDSSITELTATLKESRETQITLGVEKATSILKKLQIIQPARDELRAAILQGNVSAHTANGMDPALVRLNAAIELNKELELLSSIPVAVGLRDLLVRIKKAVVTVKAAITQGQIAQESRTGEEEAIGELNSAIEEADVLGIHKSLPEAVDLLHELMHINAQKQQVQAAMGPKRR